MSKLDLSGHVAYLVDSGRAAVSRELAAIVDSLGAEARLAVRAAVLVDKSVAPDRRAKLLGVASEARYRLAVVGRNELEIQLRARYGFVPRYQLPWCGSV